MYRYTTKSQNRKFELKNGNLIRKIIATEEDRASSCVMVSCLSSTHFFILFVSCIFWANISIGQISYTQNWSSNTGGLNGWSTYATGGSSASRITTASEICATTGTIVMNQYYGSTGDFTSPSLSTSNGGMITMTYLYKVTEFSNPTVAEAAANIGTITVEYASSLSGPWSVAQTINSSNHIASASCASKTVTFYPNTGAIYVRFNVASFNADDNYYFDDVTITQGPPPACLRPKSVAATTLITSSSARINWVAQTTGPSSGYQWEVRTSGAGGSGTTGLVSSGTTAAGVLNANVTGLLPNTSYSVYVRSNCGGSGVSLWETGGAFTTLCAVVSSFPWTEGFETTTMPSFFNSYDEVIPGCFKNTRSSTALFTFTMTDANSQTYNGPYAGSNFLSIYYPTEADTFWTPMLSLTAGESYDFSFYWVGDGYSGWEGNALVCNKQGGASATKTSLGPSFVVSSTVTSNSYVLQKYSYVPATTGNYSFGIRAFAATQDPFYLGIDNLKVEKTPPSITSVTSSVLCGGSTKVVIIGKNMNTISSATIGTSNLLPFDSISSTRLVKTITTPFSGITSIANAIGTANDTVIKTFRNIPILTVDSPNFTICSGASTIVKVTSTLTDYSTYTWTPTLGVSGSSVATFNPTSTTTYTLSAVNPATGCSNSLTRTVTMSLDAMPSAMTISQGSVKAACYGLDSLSRIGGAVIISKVFAEAANLLPTSFSLSNIAVPSLPPPPATASLTNTYYSEGNGSVRLSVVSGAIDYGYAINSNLSLVGSDSAELTWSHIVGMEGTTISYDLGYVQYSIDGGTTWNTFPNNSYKGTGTLITSQGSPASVVTGVIFSNKSYPDWNSTFTATTSTPGTGPASALWKNERVLIPSAALSSAQFRIRFRITNNASNNYYGWLIDNVKINKYTKAAITWSPTTGLYTDKAATMAYTGTSVDKVYSKPTATQKYYITATNGTCTRRDSIVDSVKSASMNLVLASASTSGAVEQCTEANGWTYYATAAKPDEWLFGIYKNGNTLNATVDITVASSPQIKRSTSGSNQGHSSIMMARSWNVTPTSFSGTNPMKVQFFHTMQEIDDVFDSVAADLTLMANPSYLYANSNAVQGSFQFVKTSNVAYNPASWVGNTYPSTILNLQYTPSTINGVTYSEFDSVFTFSGGSGGIALGSPSSGGLGKSSSGAIALPVAWGTIAATAVNEGNRVEWNTESEKNTNYFEVEYSYDARQFTTASPQVKAAGNSATARSYSFLHENEYSELLYYRIKQVDLDGKADYSKMVAVKRTTKWPEFSVSFYPVPLNVETLTVKIQTGQKTDVQVQIQDLLGRKVYTQTITPAGYETTEKLNVGHLPNGTYHVTIDNGANRIDRSIVIAK